MSHPSIESSDASPIKVEVPIKLPKVSLVNESLKKLKFHLAKFESVVKKKTTPDALTEGEWGFEHTKTVFIIKIIPFLKSIKYTFNVFDKDLLNEIMEVQTVFDQMEADVQQCSIDKQCSEIVKKELFLENDRLLQKIMSQDVLLSVMNSVTLNGESVNVEWQRSESCDKCFNLDAEFSKQNAYNDLLKSYSQLEKHCISLELPIQLNQEIFQKDKSCDNQNALELPEYFENNDLKAQLQDKDITICKLKKIIKSMRENTKEEKVNYDKSEIETLNVELENSVAKLLSENERLSKEINHVRQDLEAQIQDKVFMITSLKNNLRKLKGKEIVDSAAQIPSATTIVPGMFKLDLDPLTPRLLQNRKAHIVYLKHTQEQADILRGIVDQAKAKQPLDNALDFACLSNKAKIVESKNANNSKPNHTSGSNATDIPLSSSLVNDSKFLGTVRFGNDQIAKIMRYGDYQLGNVIILRVYYVERLGHNLFLVRQFCDADLEVAFQKNTYFIRNLEGFDLLSGSRDTNLYTISLDDKLKTSPISCALGKSKKSSHQPKDEDTNQEKLYLLRMDLFLRSKDEAPEAIIKCIKNIQVRLNATVRNVQIDNGTEFFNQTLRKFYENVGISHEKSVARTPQQNDIVERRNRTLIEAARTMLIFLKAPLFL
ncbi:retrovirus-related pol polyprotein from transposon TNT 1-94 [Tanacetum coccineum]